MTSPLAPCPSCLRHVRAGEPACPFCAAPLGEAHRSAARRPSPPRRLTRAAMFAFGSAIASSASGCYDHHVLGAAPEPRDAGGFRAEDSGGSALLYGTPPEPDVDAAVIAIDAGPHDAGVDAISVAAYGGPFPIDPPIDAGAEEDAGGAVNLYGGPPSDRGGSGG